MTDSSSRFAYRRATRPRPAASADLAMETTGVMPLPPATSSTSPSRPGGVNVPAGGRTSSSSPGATLSQIQPDPTPPATLFTVTFMGSPVCGELASE